MPLIWLVEPEFALSSLLVDLFESEGFVVRQCSSTDEITTSRMRGESGIVVADFDELSYRYGPRHAEQYARLSRLLPVVLLANADADGSESGAAPRDGGCVVVRKPPLDLDHLCTEIRTIFQSDTASATGTDRSARRDAD